MTRLPRFRAGIFAGFALTFALASACSSPEPSESRVQLGPPDGGRVCPRNAVRYLAFLDAGECRDVPSATSTGTWLARPLFPDAPEGSRVSACAYEWSSPVAPAPPPDVDALTAIGADHLSRELETSASAATCAAPLLPRGSASMVVASSDGGESAPTGVSGCDVCARLYGKWLFVILPPDKLDLRTVVVTTKLGNFVSFDVAVPAGVQAFAVELPSTTQVLYNEGRVPLFRSAL